MVQSRSVLLWLRAGSLLASPRHAVFHERSKIFQNRYRFVIQRVDCLDIGPRWMVRIPPQWLLVRSAVEKVDLVLRWYRMPGRNGFDHGRAITRLFREYRNVSELVVCKPNGRLCAEHLHLDWQVRWQVLHRLGSRRTLCGRSSLQFGDIECGCERYGRLYPTTGHRHRDLHQFLGWIRNQLHLGHQFGFVEALSCDPGSSCPHAMRWML